MYMVCVCAKTTIWLYKYKWHANNNNGSACALIRFGSLSFQTEIKLKYVQTSTYLLFPCISKHNIWHPNRVWAEPCYLRIMNPITKCIQTKSPNWRISPKINLAIYVQWHVFLVPYHGILCIRLQINAENRNEMNAMPSQNYIQRKVNQISIEFQLNDQDWIELNNTELICVNVTFVNCLFRRYATSFTLVWNISLRSAVRVQMLTL